MSKTNIIVVIIISGLLVGGGLFSANSVSGEFVKLEKEKAELQIRVRELSEYKSKYNSEREKELTNM